ncbi:hypothetical protein [Nitratifractor salsuginis]|uniref:Uncharacterized protein n=1 Tax=Nitratifractor salsuginis (strain DSM 16511 / JCM 12458 / E9I37-1) TaxID=749222 RepID=E6WZ38_NITSE|nr:hypothetical protein [Nitratifractor salsuginis]ADV45488.1 hypothetical protein Nitsa_0216 [Nitratifractor salsuginis DSM 16511]
MPEYLTAREVVGRLKMGKVASFTESYFSQLVRDGAIPYHRKPGKKRRLFIFDEVKEALEGIRDPSRDPQRKANAKRRERSSFDIQLNEVLNRINAKSRELQPECFDLTNLEDEDPEEFHRELERINGANMTLRDATYELCQEFAGSPAVALAVVEKLEGFVIDGKEIADAFGVCMAEASEKPL